MFCAFVLSKKPLHVPEHEDLLSYVFSRNASALDLYSFFLMKILS